MNKYAVRINHKEEKYNWDTYIPNGATKLILGTFPTAVGNRNFDFFYPNKRNRMWTILSSIAKHPLSTDLTPIEEVAERKLILDKLKLAMGDIGKSIYRMGEGSLDLNIFPVEYTDVLSVLKRNKKIEKVIITSSSKGNSVLNWFHDYCLMNGYTLTFPKRIKKPYSFIFLFDNRKILIEILYSVSGAAGKSTSDLIKMYSKAIK